MQVHTRVQWIEVWILLNSTISLFLGTVLILPCLQEHFSWVNQVILWCIQAWWMLVRGHKMVSPNAIHTLKPSVSVRSKSHVTVLTVLLQFKAIHLLTFMIFFLIDIEWPCAAFWTASYINIVCVCVSAYVKSWGLCYSALPWGCKLGSRWTCHRLQLALGHLACLEGLESQPCLAFPENLEIQFHQCHADPESLLLQQKKNWVEEVWIN